MELKLLILAADGMYMPYKSYFENNLSYSTASLQEDFSKILLINMMMLALLVATLETKGLMIAKSYLTAANLFTSVLIYMQILQLYVNTYPPISK